MRAKAESGHSFIGDRNGVGTVNAELLALLDMAERAVPRRQLDWLRGTDDDGDIVYNTDALKADAGLDVRELPGGWLVLKRAGADSPSGGLWLNFAVLRFHTSSDAGEFATCLFYGDGPVGALRECRHTYWGENGDGYIFYPDGKLILAALRALAEFYDDMWEAE